jgi:adenosylmethionine-8-amino-7-oxononanoate aminotransferase
MVNFIQKGQENVWLPYSQMQIAPKQLEVESTQGCQIKLKDGKVLIDGISSWWSVAHGYNHPKIVRAIKKQVQKLPHIMMAGLANDETYKLAYNLAQITPKNLTKVFFSDSGSTAVEVAMKMAVQYFINQNNNKKTKFVSFKNSYHGDTMGCMSLADLSSGMHKKFKHYLPENYSVDLPRSKDELSKFEDFLKKNKANIAGLIIEPLVQCAGGMKFHSTETLREIYKITKRHGLLFIADECAVAFYRVGKMFACEHAKISPDIMIVGKALTGGFCTLAATITSDEVFDKFLSDDLDNALMHGPTFMGNPLAASAANASLELFINGDYGKKVSAIEGLLIKELEKLKSYKKVRDVRVMGAIGVVEIDTNLEEIFMLREYFVKNEVWLRPFANVIYIMPPLVITKKELLKITDSVIEFFNSSFVEN